MYLPEDPTIPRPDQYGDLSNEDLLLVCDFWRFGALHWLRREKPDEFCQEFDRLVGRHDPASKRMRALIVAGEAESARSAYFFPEYQFTDLTEIIVRACDDCGLNSQAIYTFCHYADADLKAAICELDQLVRYLKREWTEGSAAHAEDEKTEHDSPPSEPAVRKEQTVVEPQAERADSGESRGRRPAIPRRVEMIGRATIVLDAIYGEIQLDTGKSLSEILRDTNVSHETFGKSAHFKDARDQWKSLKEKRELNSGSSQE